MNTLQTTTEISKEEFAKKLDLIRSIFYELNTDLIEKSKVTGCFSANILSHHYEYKDFAEALYCKNENKRH